MKLHEIKPAKGAYHRAKRMGMGIAAGQGRTAGRGQKGQKSRAGGVKGPYFEGGQLPLVRKLPFARGVGVKNPFRIDYAPINVAMLEERFEAGATVNPEVLLKSGLTHGSDKYVAILGNGDIAKAMNVTAHKFSATAKEKIEKAGGTVTKLEVKRGGYRTR